MKNKNKVSPVLHAVLPLVITIVYVLLGYFCKSGWAIGWILYLLIPIVESLVSAIKDKDASKFAYPVFVTAIFLFTGMMWGWWHPMWVVFVSIPAYYAICDAIKKSKSGDEIPQPEEYVQPQIENKRNTTPIIVSIIISICVILVVAIICTFSWLSGNAKFPLHIYTPAIITSDADDSYIIGGAELPTDGIEGIRVEWIDGNVDIEYYDGDKIVFSEDKASVSNEMCYKIDDETLCIAEYKNNVKKGISSMHSKDLSIKLPKDFSANEFELEIVSATVNADDLNVRKIDVETVSGTANLSFASQPQQVDIESVSGDINLNMPSDFTGYTVSKESVSGSFRANDFNNSLQFGDGATKIDFESVSADLIINKR